MSTQLTPKQFFNQDSVKNKFAEILGQRGTAFVASVMQVSTTNKLLASADPISIYQAAMIAATLDLPINNNLGFAYIVPYKGQAQFQLGYKGFIQLAQRSGQFKTIASAKVYEGQLIDENPLTGFEFDWKAKSSDEVIGYCAYFKLTNGFEKTLFMSKEQVLNHAKKYSQAFGKSFSPWTTDFDAMAEKTVLKMLLSKYAPLSVEMQKAVTADQAVIKDAETLEVDYVDNEAPEIDKERERLIHLIKTAKPDELANLREFCTDDELVSIWEEKAGEPIND